MREKSGDERDRDPSTTIMEEELRSRCAALEARIAVLEQELAGAAYNTLSQREPVSPCPETESALPSFPLELKALRVVATEGWGEGWSLRPSPRRRQWMNENSNAYHCLPLVVANQWGWQVLCPADVRVTWDGSAGAAGLKLDVDRRFAPSMKSQFGSGIVTFSPPWLFRTPPGWDLYVKGPSNRWKANCVALEGIIETWWLNYTFTINWKLVEPGSVVFAKGESLAQLVPVPHETFAGARAWEAPIGFVEPQAGQELLKWLKRRRQIASEAVSIHRLYRRAEGVQGHLQRVPVPDVEPHDAAGGNPAPEGEASR
jgi:hypothetical protein